MLLLYTAELSIYRHTQYPLEGTPATLAPLSHPMSLVYQKTLLSVVMVTLSNNAVLMAKKKIFNNA